VISVIGDNFKFTWASLALEAELRRFVQRSDALMADLLIAAIGEQDGRAVRKLIHRTTLNLKAGETRTRLAKYLNERRSDVPWIDVLEQLCFLGADRYEEGDPTIDLRDVDPRERPRWFLYPYLEHGGPTILFGPGGTGKSYLSLAAALTIATGSPFFGQLVGQSVPVLYLDWETDQYTHAERLQALCKGLGGVRLPNAIYYRRMVGSLGDQLGAVQREIERLGIGGGVVDSLAAARGGEPESADVTNRTMTAIRALAIPTLVVDHVSKAVMNSTRGEGRLSPFGSIYTENRARNTWSVRRAGEEGGDTFAVGLVHEKTNNGRYQKRHGFELSFVNAMDGQGEERPDSASIRSINLADNPDFEADLTLSERVLRFLRDQPAGTATPEETAAALGVDKKAVAPRFSELKRKGALIYLNERRRYGIASGVA
jgi:hypothetical protein